MVKFPSFKKQDANYLGTYLNSSAVVLNLVYMVLNFVYYCVRLNTAVTHSFIFKAEDVTRLSVENDEPLFWCTHHSVDIRKLFLAFHFRYLNCFIVIETDIIGIFKLAVLFSVMS